MSICAFYSLAMSARSIYDAPPRLTGSLALSIAYGIQADTPDNEFFRMYKEMIDSMGDALVPGAFFVDFLPFLKHFPSWFPGVRFHAYAEKVKQDLHAAKTRPVEYVVEQLKVGRFQAS